MATERQIGDRALELFAALLLGMATVATAWCAFQAARWNQEGTDQSRTAGQSRLEASRLVGIGTQKVAYDATIAALYAQAVVDGREDLQRFYKENLVRPDFLPIIEQWEANAASESPETLNLFENEEYLEEQAAASRVADARADEALEKEREASDNAEGFIQTTIFLASALFFAGVTANFRSRPVRLLLLGIGALTFAAGIAQIADLAVA